MDRFHRDISHRLPAEPTATFSSAPAVGKCQPRRLNLNQENVRSGRRPRFPVGCQPPACKPPDLGSQRGEALPSKPYPGSIPGNTQSWGTGKQHLPPQRMLREVAVLASLKHLCSCVGVSFLVGEPPAGSLRCSQHPPPSWFHHCGWAAPQDPQRASRGCRRLRKPCLSSKSALAMGCQCKMELGTVQRSLRLLEGLVCMG